MGVAQFGLVALLSGALSAVALDRDKALTQYSQTSWTDQQGLPQESVRAITQTSDGYLWIGTNEGLARFDGYEFVKFSRDQGDLPSNTITALAAGRQGALWIGTPKGVTSYSNRRFRTFSRKDGLPEGGVISIYVDRSDAVWLIFAGGALCRFDGVQVTSYADGGTPGTPARAVTEDSRRNVYIAQEGSIGVIAHAGIQRLALHLPAEPTGSLAASGMVVDREGNLWVLSTRGLIERRTSGEVTEYGPRDGLSKSLGLFRALVEDRDGNIWVGGDGGLARLTNGYFQVLTETEYRRQISVRALFEDREGDLWVGGPNGLIRLRDDLFTMYGRSEGLPGDEPNTVYEDRNSRIWIGFVDAGLVLFRKQGTHGPTPTGMPKGRVFSIRSSRSGDLLIAGRDGFIRLKNGRFSMIQPADSLGRHSVYDAIETSDGRIWLALATGLGELRDGAIRVVVPGGLFASLVEGDPDTLWAGSRDDGLWLIRGDERRLYTVADGLGSNQIRALYRDRNRILWIGTQDGGLNSFEGGKFFKYTASDGLLSDNIANIVDDGDSLWLNTPRGICRISKRQLEDFARRRITTLHPVNYGISDGLRSEEGAPFGGGGSRHSDGSLWFVTNRGVAVYDPRKPGRKEMPPLLQLQTIAVNGRPLLNGGIPGAPAGKGRVQIRFTAIHLRAPERVQYFYKLSGLDSSWIPANGRRTVDYDNLGHGDYNFAVRAELPDGSASEAAWAFILLPHFYETVSFRAFCACLLIVLAWLGYHWRERQVRWRFALALEERARLAREVHDTLAQGFVGIASQIDVVEMCLPEDAFMARRSLDLARRMTGHSLTEARRAVMDLRARDLEDQSLGAALQSATPVWTAGSGIDVEVDVKGDAANLPEPVAHNVLRIAQEAVNNVLKHASATRIRIGLWIGPENLQLRVADDGCGFEPGGVFVSTQGNFGLIGMRERAERLGGKLHLDSKAGHGTLVNVMIPLA